MTAGTATAGRTVEAPPPFGRDRLVHAWIAIKGISDAGDALWTVALAWTAVQVADPAVAGLVVAAGTVPRALVLLLGGVVADRLEARRVVVAVNLARVVVLLGTTAWALTTTPTIALLVCAAVAFGVCDALFEPSAATLPRQLVRPDDLPAYAGLSQTVSRLGTLLGAAAGGAVVAAGGLPASAGGNAVTYLVVVVFVVLRLRARFPLPRAAGEPLRRAVGGGFAYLREDATARTLVLALLGLNLAVSPALSIGLAVRASAEGWGAVAVGLLQALVAVGACLGAVTMLRRRRRGDEATTAFGALVLQGLAVVAAGVGPLPVTAAACLLVGVTAGIASSLLSAVFVATVRPELLGRTVSIQRLGDDVLMPVAMAGFGWLASATSASVAFTAYGAAMAVLVALPLLDPRVRGLRLTAR